MSPQKTDNPFEAYDRDPDLLAGQQKLADAQAAHDAAEAKLKAAESAPLPQLVKSAMAANDEAAADEIILQHHQAQIKARARASIARDAVAAAERNAELLRRAAIAKACQRLQPLHKAALWQLIDNVRATVRSFEDLYGRPYGDGGLASRIALATGSMRIEGMLQDYQPDSSIFADLKPWLEATEAAMQGMPGYSR
jgi:hypothetical protein